jgi:hypothetical protein
MIVEGLIERTCSLWESKHSPSASNNVRADAAMVARVRSDGFRACRIKRTVCIKVNAMRKSCSEFNTL